MRYIKRFLLFLENSNIKYSGNFTTLHDGWRIGYSDYNTNETIQIDDEFLFSVAFHIFGMDEEDPWTFDYNGLKTMCEIKGNLNQYNYIKEKIKKVMNRIISDNLDYELGCDLKYKYVEDEFGQIIIRYDKH